MTQPNPSKNSKRIYNSLLPKLWRDKRFVSMSDEARLLRLWYMTNPEVDSSGCYYMPDLMAAAHMNWEVAKITSAKTELIAAGFILFDDDTDEVWTVDWFEHNKMTSPKLAIGTVRLVAGIESEQLRNAAIQSLRKQPHTEEAIRDNYYVEEMAAESGLFLDDP